VGGEDTIFCSDCGYSVKKGSYKKHLTSARHLKKREEVLNFLKDIIYFNNINQVYLIMNTQVFTKSMNSMTTRRDNNDHGG
jgi:hypothetical protein